ncbi:Protein containing STAS (Sulphate Transporter and AntiSigma factor antagonist) domain [Desulfamplus magnetovallimortis]|uniref:Anti-sigma factor antagonist n=1 Tax=Desulfamplus magnetovallimortis TaxID=1246637 RepID=L0R3Z4_9BACT|nr:STAS domain-containing protein [Desulfamplus magnetovallimortis]CCO06733.1 Protein containing STAS (Sulphate Transporter and AntiSigma factor antagonist) domain [Desulfamplus magnetovallimortis BW-1]SLM32784.1 Protein containing STAS (Sulphate Transporter and AntiSigma factor antagonist) domain [Desulfamplus magnetovallimortis]
MPIKSTISEDNKTLTIAIEGRLDVSRHKAFGDAYAGKVENVDKVILDLVDLEYIDSSGLGMMLMLREKAIASKAEVEIINTSPGVLKIFKMTNYNKLFKIIE